MKRQPMFFRRAVIALTATLASLELSTAARAATVSGYWNSVTFEYIRRTNSRPQAAAHVLAIMQTAMYDAWTAYDPIAVPSRPNGILKRPREEMTDSNKMEAISFAAHKALVDLFPSITSSVDAALAALGYDLEDAGSSDTTAPPGIGNVAAEAVVAFGHQVGANQLGDVANSVGRYSSYDDSTNVQYAPVLIPDSNDDSDAWRPLRVLEGPVLVVQQGAGG